MLSIIQTELRKKLKIVTHEIITLYYNSVRVKNTTYVPE